MIKSTRIRLVILAFALACGGSQAFAQASCGDGLYATWRLVFSVGEFEHRATLTMNGCTGEMRVNFFSAATQRTEDITQTMTLSSKGGPDGMEIRGSAPVYTGTTTRHPSYIPDDVFYKVDTAGRPSYRVCDAIPRSEPRRCFTANLISKTDAARILLRNTCKHRIYVAIRYQTQQGRMMRRGWWALEPGALQETDITTLAQNVYFYADAQDLIFVWNGDRDVNPPRRTVETRAFTVEDDAQLTGPGSKTVSFFRATVGLDARTFTQTFNCN